MPSRSRALEGALILAGLTALWGSTFVVVQHAVSSFPPGLFTALRFALASLCFLPFLLKPSRLLLAAGLELGLYLVLGYGTQTVGLLYTSANRSAFITSTYVILVPLFASLIGHRVRPLLWLCAALAFTGVTLLSYEGSPPNRGDLFTLATAATYGIYILRLAHFSRHLPAVPLSGVSLIAVTLFSIPWAALEPHAAHTPPIAASLSHIPWPALLYLALVCTSLTTWLQTLGQSLVTATQAAVIFTLEPLFASLFSFFFQHETLGPQGWTAAALILSSALLSQIPPPTPTESTE